MVNKQVKRVGDCNRCGMCCLLCEHLIWEFQRERGKFKRLFGTCRIYGTSERKEKGCDNYPTHPDRLIDKSCGYRFIDENGTDITQYSKELILLDLDIPSIRITRRD